MNTTDSIIHLSYEQFSETIPAARDALFALGKAIDDSGLEKELFELMKLRASQINHCSFCVQFHLNIARKMGISQTKLDLVAVWEEAGIFSEQECAALAWTEKLTLISSPYHSPEIVASLQQHFSQNEIMHLTVAIANINAWNRIAGGLNFPPPIPN